MAARKSAVCCSSAACPQSLVPTSVSSGQNCWRTVSRCGQVWRMCSGVCSSKPHSQWAESARPSLFRCFLSPQWPVRRRKMVVWVLLSRVLIWSFCGSYPLFLNLQADFCFCFRRVLTSLYVVDKWGWGSFAAAFASLSAVSFPAMPTCAGTHWSTTLLLSDRVRRLLCSCWVWKSVGPFVRDWRADRESDSKTIFCWLQSSSIRSSVAAFRACTSAL